MPVGGEGHILVLLNEKYRRWITYMQHFHQTISHQRRRSQLSQPSSSQPLNTVYARSTRGVVTSPGTDEWQESRARPSLALIPGYVALWVLV